MSCAYTIEVYWHNSLYNINMYTHTALCRIFFYHICNVCVINRDKKFDGLSCLKKMEHRWKNEMYGMKWKMEEYRTPYPSVTYNLMYYINSGLS